jgi:hypothetical protein
MPTDTACYSEANNKVRIWGVSDKRAGGKTLEMKADLAIGQLR